MAKIILPADLKTSLMMKQPFLCRLLHSSINLALTFMREVHEIWSEQCCSTAGWQMSSNPKLNKKPTKQPQSARTKLETKASKQSFSLRAEILRIRVWCWKNLLLLWPRRQLSDGRSLNLPVFCLWLWSLSIQFPIKCNTYLCQANLSLWPPKVGQINRIWQHKIVDRFEAQSSGLPGFTMLNTIWI